MSNHLNIPLIWPFKMLPNTLTPGVHMDDDWACRQIKIFERKVYYKQKWKRAYTTKLQITTTIEPDDLKLIDVNRTVIKSFPWTIAAVGSGGENAWECTFDVTDAGVVPDGVYYLYQKNELLSVKFEAISEPIFIKADHRNVRVLKYKNSDNDFGVIWTTGIQMLFMCECDIMDFEPQRERNSMADQVHNVKTLSAYPWRSFKFYVGEARGVAPYIIDILNRIWCCNNVKFEDLQYETMEGSKWDTNRQKGFPLMGGSLEVTPARNLSSLQFIDVDPIAPGIITAYNIDQGFFGTANVVHITELEMI